MNWFSKLLVLPSIASIVSLAIATCLMATESWNLKNLLASSAIAPTAMFLPSVQRGSQVWINDRRWPVAWSQWQGEAGVRTGISDTGLMQIAGIELLDTENVTRQPVQWFSTQPWLFSVLLTDAYRYLEISEFAQQMDWQLQVQGDELHITSPRAQVRNIRQGEQSWGEQIVVELDMMTPWQLDRLEDRWVVLLDAATPPPLLNRFRPQSKKKKAPQEKPSRPFSVDGESEQTRIYLDTPASLPPRISTLPDPNRLVIDFRSDALVERNIHWASGIRWRQQMLDIGDSRFPVVWLEVDLGEPQLRLKPIWSDPESQVGITPLWQMAPQWQAVAAINGGFFNRDRQLSLGAIRRDGRWFSSPILNRGAMAWNEAGEVEIAHLSLQETILTAAGDCLGLQTLNSGYVGSGVSRYTPEWGATYTPILDNEIVVVVDQNRIIRHEEGGKAGSSAIPIPTNGYLLVVRDDPEAMEQLPIDMMLDCEQTIEPAVFDDYPDILAAGPLLLQNHQIVLDAAAEQFNQNFREGKAPRSAIATTETKMLLLVTVHYGTEGVGPTLEEMAEIMQQLGSVDALNLDGGSSASLSLGGQLINRSPRKVARVHNGLGIFILP